MPWLDHSLCNDHISLFSNVLHSLPPPAKEEEEAAWHSSWSVASFCLASKGPLLDIFSVDLQPNPGRDRLLVAAVVTPSYPLRLKVVFCLPGDGTVEAPGSASHLDDTA